MARGRVGPGSGPSVREEASGSKPGERGEDAGRTRRLTLGESHPEDEPLERRTGAEQMGPGASPREDARRRRARLGGGGDKSEEQGWPPPLKLPVKGLVVVVILRVVVVVVRVVGVARAAAMMP